MAKRQYTVEPKRLTSYQLPVVCAPWTEKLESGKIRAVIETFVKSRRIGGSTAAAYRAALWAAGLELHPDGTVTRHKPMDVIVVSKDFPSSKHLLAEVAEACADLSQLGSEFDCDPAATSIKMLGSGRSIEALPCSDKAIRGRTAAVIGDEVAFWRQQEAVWAAIKSVTDPTLKNAAGQPALLVTTPWDQASLAYRLFTDAEFPFKRHSVDIYEAVAAGFPIDPERAFAELGIPELCASEYLCQWSGLGSNAFFATDKLRELVEDELPAGYENHPVFYGVDVGGGVGKDFTVAVQWRRIDNDYWMTGVKAFNKLDIEAQADTLTAWIKQAPGNVRVDRGVMGVSLIQMLRNRLPRVQITGVGMSSLDQERSAKRVKRLFEAGNIRLYSDTTCGGDANGHRALMLELSQMKAKMGKGGHLIFETPRDATRGHLDRAWAALIGISDGGMTPASAGGARIGGFVKTVDFDKSGIGFG